MKENGLRAKGEAKACHIPVLLCEVVSKGVDRVNARKYDVLTDTRSSTFTLSRDRLPMFVTLSSMTFTIQLASYMHTFTCILYMDMFNQNVMS